VPTNRQRANSAEDGHVVSMQASIYGGGVGGEDDDDDDDDGSADDRKPSIPPRTGGGEKRRRLRSAKPMNRDETIFVQRLPARSIDSGG